jgi:hypothetical protein
MRSLLLLTALAACSGDQPADIDANPAGPLCTKATYDLCSTEHDCTSGLCHYFNNEFMICTQSCDASNPCPNDKNGTAGTCNGMGICKPSAPNMCHL